MSKEDNIKLAQGALNELIKCAGGCEDREKLEEEAVRVFEKLANHKPLIKRACEAFNSNKAVCYLSKHADADRGNDFAILDADSIIAKISNRGSQRELKKAASLHPLFYTETSETTAKGIEKAASTGTFDPVSEVKLNINPEVLDINIINMLDQQEDALSKLAFGKDAAEFKEAEALDKVYRTASHLGKQAKADALSICSAHYGPLMDDKLSEALKTDLPLRKFAAAPIPPKGGIYDDVENYMSCKMVSEARGEMLKEASCELVDTLRKLAGAYNLYKVAGGLLATSAMATVASPAFRKTVGLSDDDEAALLDSTITPNLKNVLSEMELKRSFFDVLNDDYISTFPVEQVQEAYNLALQKLPPKARMQPSLHTAVLRGWVTKYLSHGGTASAEDTEDVLKASRYLNGLTLRQRINDENEDNA